MLNTRIRNNGMSAWEISFQRDKMNSSQLMILKEYVNNILNKSRTMSTTKGQNVHSQEHKHIKK